MTHQITLNVYDLSRGMASSFSGMMLGTTIEGVWHTGVVIYGKEFFFGGGIQCLPTGEFSRQKNINVNRTHDLGTTDKTEEQLLQFLRTIAHKYTAESYNLMTNNCNNFSNEVVRFLNDIEDINTNGIPDYIIDLPRKVLSTPMGQSLIGPMFQQMQQSTTGQSNLFNSLNNSTNTTNSNREKRAIAAAKRIHKPKTPYNKMYSELSTKYGSNIVKMFDNMKNIELNELITVSDNNLFSISFKTIISKLNINFVDNLSTVIILFCNETEEEIEKLKEGFNKDKTEIYEIDLSTTECFEEVYELCSAFLSTKNKENNALFVTGTGNDLVFAIGLAEYFNSEAKPSLTSCLDKLYSNCSKFYISVENLESVVESCDEVNLKNSLELVSELHKESENNKLNVSLTVGVEDILSLGMKDLTKEKVLRVLRTTKGDVDAAMNLLLH